MSSAAPARSAGEARIDTAGNSVATMLGNGSGGIDLYMTRAAI